MYVTLIVLLLTAAAATWTCAATEAHALAADATVVSSQYIQTAAHVARSAYRSVIVWPIYRLYRYGPALHGYGFWRGAPPHEVCAQLTHVDAAFWRDHPRECEARMLADVDAAVVLIETLAYFAVLFVVVRWLLRSATPYAVAWCRNVYDWMRRRYERSAMVAATNTSATDVMNEKRTGNAITVRHP